MFINSYLRKNQFFQNLNIMSLLILLFLSFSILPTKSFSQEDTISSIIVDGNKRITSETIIAISKIEKGALYSPSQLNSALQLIKKSTFSILKSICHPSSSRFSFPDPQNRIPRTESMPRHGSEVNHRTRTPPH